MIEPFSDTAFRPGASSVYTYQDIVRVPNERVEEFETYLEEVRDAGLVFEVVGRSE